MMMVSVAMKTQENRLKTIEQKQNEILDNQGLLFDSMATTQTLLEEVLHMFEYESQTYGPSDSQEDEQVVMIKLPPITKKKEELN